MHCGGRSKAGVQFNCFSPPVMLATFIIEIVLAIYTIWRYRWGSVTKLAVAMMTFLALFQISEYFVCGGAGLTAESWARAGYASITLLPPLGLHLLYLLAGKKERRLVIAAYTSAGLFVAYFLGFSGAFTGYQCTGNYVIFQLAVHSGLAYGVYYYGWLLTAIVLADRWMRQLRVKAGSISHRQTLGALVMGYLVFLIPTAIANTVKPETRRGIPSIMCGFAVLFVLIIAFYILPRAARVRKALE